MKIKQKILILFIWWFIGVFAIASTGYAETRAECLRRCYNAYGSKIKEQLKKVQAAERAKDEAVREEKEADIKLVLAIVKYDLAIVKEKAAKALYKAGKFTPIGPGYYDACKIAEMELEDAKEEKSAASIARYNAMLASKLAKNTYEREDAKYKVLQDLYEACIKKCNPDPEFMRCPGAEDIAILGKTIPYQFSPASSPNVKDTIEISYTLPFKSYVSIPIYDSGNSLVRTVFADQETYIGDNTFTWDGKDDLEVLLSEGIYRYVVIAHDMLDPNKTYTESNEILIDNTPPTAIISQITSDYPEPGKTEIRGTAQEENLESYTLECLGASLEKERREVEVANDILVTVDTYYLPNGTYTFELVVTDLAGNSQMAQNVVNLTAQDELKVIDLSISNNPISLRIAPTAGILDTTSICYTLSHDALIDVGIYDSGDEPVRQLASESQNPGLVEIIWDGNNDSGTYVSQGDYTVRISSGATILAEETITVTNNISKITKPYEASLVRAYIPVTGTASCENFSHYTVEYGQGENPSAWISLLSSTNQVVNNLLTMWDTGYNHPAFCTPEVDYPQEGLIGPYSLRLTVYDAFNNQYVDKITVKVGRVLSNEWGGEARSPDDNVHLNVDPLSLRHSFELVSIFPADMPPQIPTGLSLVGTIYELEAPGITFAAPSILTISYLDSEISTLDETKLAIYEWDVLLQRWKYIPTTIDIDNNILTSQISCTPLFRAYYAVFCDGSMPQAPVLYQPHSPSNKLSTVVYGETDSETSVEIIVNGQSQGTSKIARGNWFAKEIILDEGINYITAQAIDVAGNISDSSNQIDIEVALGPPTAVSGIGGYESDFSAVITTTQAGSRLYIEIIGEDSDPTKINTTTVLVVSSSTDTTGIIVTLTETGIDAGVYRGVIYIGTESNKTIRTIGALDGEIITISSTADPSKEISMTVEDTTAPGAPSIYSSTNPSVCQDTFEDNLGDWQNRSGISGASIYRDGTTSATGAFSAKIVNTYEGGDFSCYALEDSFDVATYPMISFDYKIPEGVKTNFIIKVNGAWNEIRFTDDPSTVGTTIETIGELEDVIADNEWHHAEIDLLRMLENHYPEAPSFTVTEVIMGEWDLDFWYSTIPGGNNAQGATYWIDNFVITRPVAQPFEINWTAPPDEPIDAGYSYSIDQVADTTPDTTSEGTATSVVYDGLTDGTWYFHIRIQDNAGNWSGANHYMILKDDTPPQISLPYPPNGAISGSPVITLLISDDPGLGVDKRTIKLEVEDIIYDISSPTLDYSSANQTLTFMPYKIEPASLVFADGQQINVSLLSVSDKAANIIPSSYSWSWVYDVDLDITPPEAPTILYPKSHTINAGKIVITWIAHDTSGIAGYSFVLDKEPHTIVDDVSEGQMMQQVYELVEGEYYFHAAAVDNAGNWSDVTHFKLNVLPSILPVDDFNDGAKPNLLGGDMGVFTSEDGSACMSKYIDSSSMVLGGWGYSMQLDYDILYGNSFAGYWTALNNADLSAYNALEFWIRGASGGERFTFYLKDYYGNESKLDIASYLPGGVTTSWQKATVPLSNFNQIVSWNEMDSFVIIFEGAINSGSGTIYLDNVSFTAGHIPVDDFDAAIPPNEPGSPYWSFDNGTILQAGYDYIGPYGGDGYSLELTYSGVTPDNTCGWILTLGDMNVSNLNMLGFYVKGMSGGENFNVYLSDGINRAYVDIRDYLTLRTDWHHVKIPLIDFANQGLDFSNLERLEIVFEWEEMSGTIYLDNIEFTNKLFKDPSIGPVRTLGQNLLVRGKLFMVKGVGYQPTPIGYYPYDPCDGSPFMDVFADTPYNHSMWDRDLLALRYMGCNTVKTWGKVTSTAFLDACYNNGLDPTYVIMGMWLNNKVDYSIPENRMQVIDEFAHYVQTYKDHPAVLAWAVGNEDNYWYTGITKGLYTLINEMARTAYEIEGPTYHPVLFPGQDLLYIGDASVRATDTAMNYLDIWACNVYRGDSFGDLFVDYQFRSTKPLLITEYGIDALDNMHSVEYEDTQASYAVSLWDEVVANSNFCVGAAIMEYCDEWWKDDNPGATPADHNYGGYEIIGAHPDGFSNEEWWGIMRTVDNGTSPDIMEPRQVYYDLKDKWSTELLIDDFNDGSDPNELGGASGVFDSGGLSYCHRRYATLSSEILGNTGYSMALDYNLSGPNSYAGFYTFLNHVDIRPYKSLSFWVKSYYGGDKFKVGFKSSDGKESKVNIDLYLEGGASTKFQQVIIPLVMFKNITDWSDMENFSIIFEEALDASGIVCIENIELLSENNRIVVDNFDDGRDPNAFGSNYWTFNHGASITTGYVPEAGYDGTYCYGVTYSGVYFGTYCGLIVYLADISVADADRLSFYIKGSNPGSKPNIYLYDGTNRAFVNIEDYKYVTTGWQRVDIPLTDFSNQGVNLTHVRELSFVFEWEDMNGEIYLDNIEFTNYPLSIRLTLNETPEATNKSPIVLSGAKSTGTSIWINEIEVVPLDYEKTWSVNFALNEGLNDIAVSAKDNNGHKSEEARRTIELDTQVPMAVITAKNTAYKNEIITFDGSQSSDNYGIASYVWNFGDGSPQAEGKIADYAYTDTGVYNITLTVYDIAGNGPISDITRVTILNDAPVAGFTATPANGEAPLKVDFNDTSLGKITGWLWDFGDGTTSILQNPVHTYNSAGTYTVKLTVTGPGGSATETKMSFVTAYYTLNVTTIDGNITVFPDKPCYGHNETVTLTAEPDTGYHFNCWMGDVPLGDETDNPLILNMDDGKSITADFTINSYILSTNASYGGIIISPDKLRYDYGEDVTLIPVPNGGFCFLDWQGDVPDGYEEDVPLILVMDSDKFIIARFDFDVFYGALQSENFILGSPEIIVSGGDAGSGNYSLEDVSVGNVFRDKAKSTNYSLEVLSK